jgi:hypothetical protein
MMGTVSWKLDMEIVLRSRPEFLIKLVSAAEGM